MDPELVEIIKNLGLSVQEFKAEYSKRLDLIENAVVMQQTPDFTGEPGSTEGSSRFAVDIDGKKIPVLGKADKMINFFPKPTAADKASWDLGEYTKANLGLDVRAAVIERGPALVPDFVSAEIIDAVRAKSRLVQAGALTIPIKGKTTLCRIASDPTIIEHTEAANDITESIPVLEPVALDPKMLAALIPISIELIQDSPNLNQALQMSIAAAFASKLDVLGVATILADSNIPTSSSTEATDAWAGILTAVGSMLAANQELPKTLICSPADFIARASQLASTGGTWLGAPPVLAKMLDLDTSGMSDATAILGDFASGFGIAVRMDISTEIIRWGKPGYGSHLLAAWARMAGYVLQPKSLYIPKAVA